MNILYLLFIDVIPLDEEKTSVCVPDPLHAALWFVELVWQLVRQWSALCKETHINITAYHSTGVPTDTIPKKMGEEWKRMENMGHKERSTIAVLSKCILPGYFFLKPMPIPTLQKTTIFLLAATTLCEMENSYETKVDLLSILPNCHHYIYKWQNCRSRGMHDMVGFIWSWHKALRGSICGSFINPCPVCFHAVSQNLNGKWAPCFITVILCLDVCLFSKLSCLRLDLFFEGWIKEWCINLSLPTVKCAPAMKAISWI